MREKQAWDEALLDRLGSVQKAFPQATACCSPYSVTTQRCISKYADALFTGKGKRRMPQQAPNEEAPQCQDALFQLCLQKAPTWTHPHNLRTFSCCAPWKEAKRLLQARTRVCDRED